MFQRSIQRALLKVRSAREAARRELRFLKEDSQLYAGALKGVRLRHVEVGGLELVVRANEAVGRSLYFRGRFEEWESAFITSQVRRDDVCVDVGANIGYFAVLMASLGAHVHAFDPLTLNVRLVALNAALNGLDVTINQLALSDASGEKQLVESEDSAFSSFVDTGRKGVARVSMVRTTTLDAYLADHAVSRVDVLKIDVEGAEAAVLCGATELFRSAPPRLVLAEVHDEMLRLQGSSSAEVLDTMAAQGYEPYQVGEHELTPVRKSDGLDYNVAFLRG